MFLLRFVLRDTITMKIFLYTRKGGEIMAKDLSRYLLVSDMDGTLLNNTKEISEENIEAIKRFQQLGGKFTIATGRVQFSTEPYLKDITLDTPAILYNGAVIYDFYKKDIIWQKHVNASIKERVKRIYEEFPGLGIGAYCGDKLLIIRHNLMTVAMQMLDKVPYYSADKNIVQEYENTLLLEDGWERPWNKVILAATPKFLDEMEDYFINNIEEANVMRSGDILLELLPIDISKGTSLEKLAQYMNMDMEHVIAIGDNMNDLDMLTRAGHGFTVTNCNEKLRPYAKYCLSSNEDHALVHVVKWAEENL